MSKMIPPYYSEEIKSSGEKQLFDFLRQDPATTDWICLHSLSLGKHVNRVYGEIDFVVLVPNAGIFCLEVKSGRVAREKGVWAYTNRYGKVFTSTVGPFRQARDGMFSLIESIRKHFGQNHRFTKLLYGFGVVFPHVIFSHDDPEIASWQVYDRTSRRHPVSSYIQNLSKQTHRSMEKQNWYDSETSRPNRSDIMELTDFLRGDFERIVKPTDALLEMDAHFLRLTEEQYNCLDHLRNNPRCLFEGGAGTGKTLLALEFARREASLNRKVLMVCYNKMLGKWIAGQVQKPLGDSVVVDSFHQYLERLICGSSVENQLKVARKNTETDPTYLFDELYPLLALDALDEGVIEPFDTLVIDEGQDLIRSEFLDVLDGLLIGGLAGGKWSIFCDFNHQTIYGDFDANTMLGELESRVSGFVRFELMTNCRNTRRVGEEVSLISGSDLPMFLPSNIEGLPVNYLFYTDDNHQSELLRESLSHLRADGIKNEAITILSPMALKRSSIGTGGASFTQIIDLSLSERLERSQGSIGFSTIHAFKGLESSVVIITDVKHLLDDQHRALMYVGMSRAKHRLLVLMHESAREEYQEAVRQSIRMEASV